MERESFEDEKTAAVMNENFICIKVDREERPDVDRVYMEACQAISGGGGCGLRGERGGGVEGGGGRGEMGEGRG